MSMRGPNDRRRDRRTLAVAMVLSVLVHGVVLALVQIDVPLWPGSESEEGEAIASADRYLTQQPLELVQIRVTEAAAADEAASVRAAETERAAPAAEASFRPTPGPTASALSLEPVARRPVPDLSSAVADARATEPARDLNRGVTFVGASEAARLAERDLERASRSGRLSSAGSRGSGGGISISIVGAGGNCDTPATGVFDRFSGSFGDRGIGGRRF